MWLTLLYYMLVLDIRDVRKDVCMIAGGSFQVVETHWYGDVKACKLPEVKP
jgi:hypothetical protein